MNYDSNTCLIPSATVQNHDDSQRVQKALRQWKKADAKRGAIKSDNNPYWMNQSSCNKL